MITRMKRVLLLASATAACVWLTACSSCMTPYGPMGWKGGYEDTHIKDNTYYVNVQVNAYTSPIKAAEYFHRRAKELCEANGYGDYRISGERNTSTQMAVGSYGGGSMSASTMNKPGMAGYVDCLKKK